MQRFRALLDYRKHVMLYGLAAVVFTAGVTKFIAPELWLGYYPTWISLPATKLTYVSGAIEATAGILLAARYRVKIVASLVALWLLAITVTVASLGMWTIALRDIGLVVLAYGVASDSY